MDSLLILGIGVSPYKTDGVLRFEYFCKLYQLDYKILGEGCIWHGGNMYEGPGGGQKINEIIKELESMIDNKLIIICDTFDLIPISKKEEILDKYQKIASGKVLFSSELYCWPDKSLANTYPHTDNKYKFLNSGTIMGYRNDIYNIIKEEPIKDNEDDQLFFTKKYLSGKNIILDHNCEIFQTINGASQDLSIFKNRIYNKYTNSYPIFLHGNGPSKNLLNNYENYLDSRIYLSPKMDSLNTDNMPCIFLALYIDSSNNPDIMNFFDTVADLKYKNKIVCVYDKSYSEDVAEILSVINYIYRPHIYEYNFVDDFLNSGCEFYFLLEEKCFIKEKYIIQELISFSYCNEYYRVICPMLVCRNNKTFSNFWGAIRGNGFYDRSENYLDIINYRQRGIWNVPYVSRSLLIHKSIIQNWDIMKPNKYSGMHIDMQLCQNLRNESIFMYVINLHNYGYMCE